MKVAITAPVYIKNPEHKKYMDLCTRSIISLDHDIVWLPVENYIDPSMLPMDYAFEHEPDEIKIVPGKQPQSVAGAWNTGIEVAGELGCDYVIVINTDIVFKSDSIDKLVAFAQKQKDAVMWTMSETPDLALLEEAEEDENFSEHPHFSCFMVKPDFFKYVGRFDENFRPAYCEDGDMHARLALAGLKAHIYGGAKFFHFGSRTIKSDAKEWEANQKTFPANQEYFLKKWGHPIVNETERMREVYYKKPFNQDVGLDYWESP